MDGDQLRDYLHGIDRALNGKGTLCIYGSAAYILLGEPDRTSLDIDVAGPYSDIEFDDFSQAAMLAGIPVNPAADSQDDHIEWITALRLCLPKPDSESEIVLWQGKNLIVKTTGLAKLIVSKLIRYDEIDKSDIQFLCKQHRMKVESLKKAVTVLPSPFCSDPIVLDNLDNLIDDMGMWGVL